MPCSSPAHIVEYVNLPAAGVHKYEVIQRDEQQLPDWVVFADSVDNAQTILTEYLAGNGCIGYEVGFRNSSNQVEWI